MKRKVCGIVCEYNPFHSGHQYQIQETRRFLASDEQFCSFSANRECAVVAVMSGNFVQRSQPALFDKWTRARAAVAGGVNLVLELPTLYATAGAEQFARAAVSILQGTGAVTHLSFGSESGDLEGLREVAAALNRPEFRDYLAEALTDGSSFAAARQKALTEMLGARASLLSHPNDILAVEYLKAIDSLSAPFSPLAVRRLGAGHHERDEGKEHLSATAARLLIARRRWDKLSPYVLSENLELYREAAEAGAVAENGKFETALLTALRRISPEDYRKLGDVSEGLENRLYASAQSACDLEGLYHGAKAKRYALSRIRRIYLAAYLGIKREEQQGLPPYIRVLAFDDTGRELLREMRKCASLPILMKAAVPEAMRYLRREAQFTDQYTALLQKPLPCGLEFTQSPLYLRGEK